MISRNLRRFATTAYRAAEIASKVDAANQYRVQLAKAQGHVNGFVGGRLDVCLSKPSYQLKTQQQLAIPHLSG